ncbi:MAG TPA: PRC-barrel domain-containing protein [Longimicrobiales bacterium]
MIDPLRPSPDLNELPVYDAEGVPIGQTFGVLTEADTGLVRYFDVSLEARRRHVLIPVGHARLEMNLGRLRLRLRAAAAADLENIPAYEPHVPWSDDDFQNELLTAFGRLFQGQRYYAHPAFDHTGLYAGKHPILREPLAPAAPTGLRRLSKLSQYRIADGEPDVIDWDVVGPSGSELGTTKDVIIDADAEQVRYLVLARATDDVEVAVPIGYVVVLDEKLQLPFSIEDLSSLPPAPAEELTRDQEVELRLALDRVLTGQRRYARPDFRFAA